MVFRRYTDLAATIHLLTTKHITLLNPATWDDRNDAYFMAEYKRLKNAKTVLALCFTERGETYHHWRVFSHGANGVCLDFDKEKLLGAFAGDCRIETRAVAYKRIKDAQEQDILANDLPFLKRYPYKDEQEFRVVFVDVNEHFEFFEYPLLLGWIRRITLSPWMSEGLAKSVRTALRSIDGCGRLPVSRSTLVNNEAWKTLTAGARA